MCNREQVAPGHQRYPNGALPADRACTANGARNTQVNQGLKGSLFMINPRALAISVVGMVISIHGVGAQDLPKYRNFELGSNLASVSTLAAVDPSEAKTIHQRPAVMQDLEWRLSRWVSGSSAPSTDPVEKIVFSFYNDQLFRL